MKRNLGLRMIFKRTAFKKIFKIFSQSNPRIFVPQTKIDSYEDDAILLIPMQNLVFCDSYGPRNSLPTVFEKKIDFLPETAIEEIS